MSQKIIILVRSLYGAIRVIRSIMWHGILDRPLELKYSLDRFQN
ncbi:MAG: hypothetical protein QXR45_09665 [Candidatus Bathyarchaeia archaeon]